MRCRRCGYKVLSTASLCGHCGEPLVARARRQELGARMASAGEGQLGLVRVALVLAGALAIAARAVDDLMRPSYAHAAYDTSLSYGQLLLGLGIVLVPTLLAGGARYGVAFVLLALIDMPAILVGAGWCALSALGDRSGASFHTCAPGEAPGDVWSNRTFCVPNAQSDQYQLVLHGAAGFLLLAAIVVLITHLLQTRPGKRAYGSA